MSWDWLLAWWNLIFVVPFGLGLVYMGLYITTGVSFGEGDGDVDGDADAEGDLDADGDADIDGDTNHKLHIDAGSWLQLLGIGRVPLSVVVMTLLMTWGFIGVVLNRLLFEVLAEWMLPLVSIPLAGLGSVMATGVLARVIGRLMPLDESSAWRKRELVGSTAEALYPIDAKFGMAIVRDPQGERYQIPCRVGEGTAPIVKGQSVLLVEYEANEDFFIVRPYELAATPRASAEAPGGQDFSASTAPVRTPLDESASRS